jgi:hypothetical protein
MCTNFVCIMIVLCNGCMLFKLSCYMFITYSFWALTTFAVSFFVLGFWTNRTNMFTKRSAQICKNTILKKTIYSLYNINFVSGRLLKTNKKPVRLLLDTTKNCSRRPSLAIFQSHSVNQWSIYKIWYINTMQLIQQPWKVNVLS